MPMLGVEHPSSSYGKVHHHLRRRASVTMTHHGRMALPAAALDHSADREGGPQDHRRSEEVKECVRAGVG